MRGRSSPGLRLRGRWDLGLLARSALLLLLLVGCGEEKAPPRNPPDAFLRDSLGLTDDDPVFRVALAVVEGGNVVAPPTVEVPRGAWVEFVTRDGWPRRVTFGLDSLPSAAAELLRSTGQDASPPLLNAGTRFVVSFEGAPAGRYPYRVEGSARPAAGVVVVVDPDPGR